MENIDMTANTKTVWTSRKIIIATCAILLLSGAGVAAQSIQLDLGNGLIGVAPPPEERRFPCERYDDRRGGRVMEDENVGVSCREGRRIVASRGFRDVRPLDCGSRSFVYSARERGSPVEVTVSARDGRIVSVQPL
jgi:hypothetical protein